MRKLICCSVITALFSLVSTNIALASCPTIHNKTECEANYCLWNNKNNSCHYPLRQAQEKEVNFQDPCLKKDMVQCVPPRIDGRQCCDGPLH